MFKDLVYKAFNVNTQEEFNSIFKGFEGSTLIFELTSRENRVVTSYEGTQIWLLAVRDNVTGNYIDINEVISRFKKIINLINIQLSFLRNLHLIVILLVLKQLKSFLI